MGNFHIKNKIVTFILLIILIDILYFFTNNLYNYTFVITPILQSKIVKYIYIIRQTENNSCISTYFSNFSIDCFISENIQSELYNVVPLSIPIFNILKIKNMVDIRILSENLKKLQNTYNNILISIQNQNISILAQNLGCSKCYSWNKNPTEKMKDDKDLYDMVWVLEYKNDKVNFFTIQDNFISICNKSQFNYISV
jgi:hypothetical protein